MTGKTRPGEDLWVFHMGWSLFLFQNVMGLACRMSEGKICPGACKPKFNHPFYYLGALAAVLWFEEGDRWGGVPRRRDWLDGWLGFGLGAFWAVLYLYMRVAAARNPALKVPGEAATLGLGTAYLILGAWGSRFAYEERVARRREREESGAQS